MQASTQNNPKITVILATGGTIAGQAASATDNIGYTAAQIGVAQLAAAVPALAQLPFEAEQVAQIDSKDMGFAVWQALLARAQHHLAREEVGGIVITHGTDTLEETAFFLHALLPADKPVVLTCAMRPATSLQADGPQNLSDALAVARHTGARGVLAVCAGVVHGAQEVQKLHSYRLDAFSSGDAGPLAYVEEGSVRQVRNWPLAGEKYAQEAIKSVATGALWPRVEVVMSYAGASADTVRALVASGVQGLIVAGTGNGTVHADLHAALLAAQSQGVAVRRATRCALGRVLPVAGADLPDSHGLTPVKARIALMLELLARA
jgi:L-asparaginase